MCIVFVVIELNAIVWRYICLSFFLKIDHCVTFLFIFYSLYCFVVNELSLVLLLTIILLVTAKRLPRLQPAPKPSGMVLTDKPAGPAASTCCS